MLFGPPDLDLSFWMFFSSAGVGLEPVSRDSHHLAEALFPSGGPEGWWKLPSAPVLSGHLHPDDTGNGHTLTWWLNGFLMREIETSFAFIIADFCHKQYIGFLSLFHMNGNMIQTRGVCDWLLFFHWISYIISDCLPMLSEGWLGLYCINMHSNNISKTTTYPTLICWMNLFHPPGGLTYSALLAALLMLAAGLSNSRLSTTPRLLDWSWVSPVSLAS